MVTALIFIAILALIILAHEWGHFWAARRSGIRVEEFGFGFPPRLLAWKKNDTVFSLNLIPLGGFVKIFGEEGNETKGDPESFAAQSVGRRAKIITAGVIMNVLLAFILLSFVQGLGVPSAFEGALPAGAQNPIITIVEVVQNSPAGISGLKVGDGIVEMRSKDAVFKTAEVISESATLDKFHDFVQAHAGEELLLAVKRGGTIFTTTAIPRISHPTNEGALGIAMVKTALIKNPWYLAPWEGLKMTGQLIVTFSIAIVNIFKEAFTTGKLTESLTGPVGIIKITAQTVSLGFVFLLQLVAILSINIALINILPFPALDGGRLLFLGVEKVRGRPLKKETERWVNTAGFFLLILLMIFITIKDIHRIF